ncbi:MAG: lamin tail domain-containing protein [Bacteroidales bacterium]|nr:lamin tail domain-containing protein [Bacteroidales bacterium]
MKKIFTVCAFLCAPFCMHAQVFEQFDNLDAGSTYSSGMFTGNHSITWNYCNARGNQKLTQNGDKAISFNKAENASLISDSIPNGIKSISFLYEQTLTTNCDMLVFVNDSCIGRIYTNDEKGVTKSFSSDIYTEGNFVIKLQQTNSNSGQITIDDITITFAKIPFTYISHEFTDSTFTITYSLPIQTITIEDTYNGITKETYIFDNRVITHLNTNYCGEASFEVSQCTSTTNDLLQDTIFTHNFYAKPTINDIIITEIMADPSPIVGLPEVEYIELFNRTNCPIQCKNLSLHIGNSIVSLPNTILAPQKFICLVPNKTANLFPQISNCIEISLPAITNSGTTITLYYLDNIISSVSFTSNWYKDSFKENGGWSLEKIDFENFSETMDNWTAANNKLGGTPGYNNSIENIHTDTTSPYIENIQVQNDSTLIISFSENIDFNMFMNNISWYPELQISTWRNTQNSLSQYEITTKEPCDFSKPYTILLNENCTDYNGNSFKKSNYTFAKTDSIINSNSITINEILFNPTKNQNDFIELYNTSSSYFDLSELFISNGDKYLRVTDQFTLFPPHSYAVLSSDCSIYTNKCSAIFITTNLITMPDDAGTILLVNKWKETIDSLTYNKSWHAQYLKDVEGVSLEKFSPELSSHLASSWGSASESIGFSTPGCENSQLKIREKTKYIALLSEVVTPNNDGENDQMILSFNNIEYGTYLNAKVYATNGKLINHFANNELLGANNTIKWDCTDSRGILVNSGIYIIHAELLRNGKKISSEKICCTILWE